MSAPKEISRAYHGVCDLLSLTHAAKKRSPREYAYTASKIEVQLLLPQSLLREEIRNWPELSEPEVVRHFTRLSQLNFGLEGGFYPLGSCTMKYNPKVNETVVSEEGFSCLHPYAPEAHTQGALELMYALQQALTCITGLDVCSLQPAAGAHGELVGVKMIKAYHRKQGDVKRKTILVPDSSHGTNPASAALCGFDVKQIASNANGVIDAQVVEAVMDETVAGLMITVPNTLGIFEKHLLEIAQLVHKRGGLIYGDGANLNALMGKVDFGKLGIDVMHINLHKTFSSPHGGGGPGAGPVVAVNRLKDFLPTPIVIKNKNESYQLSGSVSGSVGRFRSFYGNFGVLVRALCYIRALGAEGLEKVSEDAVLNANYVKARLKNHYHLPFDQPSLHEVVFSDKNQASQKVTTLDIAKRLMDFGIHPPTVYFPLIVKGALMIEPTETESKEELDHFVSVMIQIANEAQEDPQKVQNAPHNLGITRLDETRAARTPILTWEKR